MDAPTSHSKSEGGADQKVQPQRPAARSLLSVGLLDEGSTTPETLTVTQDLAALFARASAIGKERRNFDLSFSSLFLGLISGTDRTCRWMADYCKRNGVKIDYLYKKTGTDEDTVALAVQRAIGSDMQAASPLLRTVSARRALDEAKEIATGQGSSSIDVPHLTAAMLSLTNYHEDDFEALSLNRPAWGAAFVQHSIRGADAAEADSWKRFYERRFPGHALPESSANGRRAHRPDYDADAYTSRDLLDIEDEVQALAYVIASTKTHPPLAIGLFGEWGSGKTFFMCHLRDYIEKLSAGSRAQQPRERACHAGIVQIDFNAWHYQEGDLWASLVDHILRNLRFGQNEDETKLAERRDVVIKQIGEAEGRENLATQRAEEAEKRVAAASDRLSDLQIQQEKRREALAKQLTPGEVLAAAKRAVSVDENVSVQGRQLLEELGVIHAGMNAIELQTALSEAKRELDGIGALIRPLMRPEGRRKRLLLLAASIAAPPLVFVACSAVWSAQDGDLVGRISGVVGGIGTFLLAATGWIRSQAQWLNSFRTKLEPVARRVNEQIETELENNLSEHGKRIAEQIAELQTLKQEEAAAQSERQQAAAEASALRSELSSIGEDHLLRAFLDERIRRGDYQKRLGIAALVRRDFDRLSTQIVKLTEAEQAGSLTEHEKKHLINRIVLYIDDLDRCDEKKVVAVLRAVHLLLAFKAFVVVVGVDSRWVAHCLKKHFRDVLVDDEGGPLPRVSPLDYLEKIFQIPIWLEPVPPKLRVSMASELLRSSSHGAPKGSRHGNGEDEHQISEGSGKPSTGVPKQAQSSDEEHRKGDEEATNGAGTRARSDAEGGDENGTAGGPAGEQVLDLNPVGLEISDHETAFLEKIDTLLSPSPRLIKRFVNTYRLINVGVGNEEGAADATSPPDFQVRMLLLCIFVDMPDCSRALQEVLQAWARSADEEALLTKLMQDHFASPQPTVADASHRAQLESRHRASEEWARIEEWLRKQGPPWSTIPAARFATWLNRVGRYTFNLTRSPFGLDSQSAFPAAAAAGSQADDAPSGPRDATGPVSPG